MCQTLTAWGCEQQCQCKRADHLNVLRIEKQSLPFQAVSEDTTDKRKKHDWQLPQEEIQAQVKGIFGEIVDKPTVRTAAQMCQWWKRTLPAT